MEKMAHIGLVLLAGLGFVAWLGGGRKWAFRTTLVVICLALMGFAGVLISDQWVSKAAERRMKKIHECAVAKVGTAHCEEHSSYSDVPPGALVCPAYMLFDSPTPEQESAAIATAEDECTAEIDPHQRSLHQQIEEYRHEHGIKVEDSKAANTRAETGKHQYIKLPDGSYGMFAADASDEAIRSTIEKQFPGAFKKALSPAACAAKVRTFYPGVYDDLNDVTLARKVVAKYPRYCDITSTPPDFIPEIKGIRR